MIDNPNKLFHRQARRYFNDGRGPADLAWVRAYFVSTGGNDTSHVYAIAAGQIIEVIATLRGRQ